MSYIVSINGTDGSGKTTQINLLQKYSNSQSVYFTPDISAYNVFPNLSEKEFFNWWFFDSDIEEFCKAIYTGIKCRDEDIKSHNKSVVVIDKGIDTFESRIIANFICRGMKKSDIIFKMSEIKDKLNIKDNEDLKILLLTDSDIEKRMNIVKSRRVTSYGQSYYDKYQYILNEVLQEQINTNCYNIINASKSIDEVNQLIINEMKSGFVEKNKKIKINVEKERF